MSVCDNCATGSSSAGVTSANIVDAVVWAVPGRLRSRLARSDGGRGRLVRAGWRRASPHGKYKSSAKSSYSCRHTVGVHQPHTHTLEPHLPPRERRTQTKEEPGTRRRDLEAARRHRLGMANLPPDVSSLPVPPSKFFGALGSNGAAAGSARGNKGKITSSTPTLPAAPPPMPAAPQPPAANTGPAAAAA